MGQATSRHPTERHGQTAPIQLYVFRFINWHIFLQRMQASAVQFHGVHKI